MSNIEIIMQTVIQHILYYRGILLLNPASYTRKLCIDPRVDIFVMHAQCQSLEISK